MHDQAQELRKLMKQVASAARQRRTEPPAPPSAAVASTEDPPSTRPHLLVIAGGKGGVGVTTLSVLIARQLAREQQRVALIDFDTQRGDVAAMTGVLPTANIDDVLQARLSTHDALQPGPDGILVLPANWLGEQVPPYSPAMVECFVHQLLHLGRVTDWVVVDAGNGDGMSLWQPLWTAADVVAIVTTCDAVAVMDAYAIIKQQFGNRPHDVAALKIQALVNQAADREQAFQIQTRLALSCRRFLNTDIASAGWVPCDQALRFSSETRPPRNTKRETRRAVQRIVRRWITDLSAARRPPPEYESQASEIASPRAELPLVESCEVPMPAESE